MVSRCAASSSASGLLLLPLAFGWGPRGGGWRGETPKIAKIVQSDIELCTYIYHSITIEVGEKKTSPLLRVLCREIERDEKIPAKELKNYALQVRRR